MWIPCLPRASASGQLVSRAQMPHTKRPIHQEFHPIACSQMCRVEPCFGYAEGTGSWLTCGIEIFVSKGHATASSSCYCKLLLATPPNGWKLTSSDREFLIIFFVNMNLRDSYISNCVWKHEVSHLHLLWELTFNEQNVIWYKIR